MDQNQGEIEDFARDLGLKSSYESQKKRVVDKLSTNRIQSLDPPLNPSDSRYNCLIRLVGIPYNFTEFMMAKWLEDYGVTINDITYLLEFNGSFTGDAYVRCLNREIQKKIIEDKHMNHISDRYIEIYPINETAYKQYYRAKYYKKLRRGFYIPLETLVPYQEDYKMESKNLKDLECGDLIIGKIIQITDKGCVIKPLNMITDDAIFILCKDRLARNVTFKESCEGIQVRLILGMEINLYYEKLIRADRNSDIWDKNPKGYNDGERPLDIVYLTMDCNIYEKKQNSN